MTTLRPRVLWGSVGLLLWLSGAAFAQTAPVKLVKGPYLQDVTVTSITVMWETREPGSSRVEYGPTPGYGHVASDPAPATIHKVTLGGLQPDTLYHYRVTGANGSQVAAREDATFRTAVRPGAPFRFAAYGDSRSSPSDHARVLTGLAARAPRFVLHTGDFVGDGDNYGLWQAEFFGPAAALLRNTPLYPCLGNHEKNAEWYYRFFATPRGGGDHGQQWYSFDYGAAHFVVIDTDANFSPGSAQYAWLENDLKSARAEWLFAVHHHPAYSSGAHGSTRAVQQYLVPLYQAYKVDMDFSGHDHLYERSFKDGVYYIVTGGGGAPIYPGGLKRNPYRQYGKAALHFCTVDINGKTATLQAHRPDGTVFDSVVMRHGPEARAGGSG